MPLFSLFPERLYSATFVQPDIYAAVTAPQVSHSNSLGLVVDSSAEKAGLLRGRREMNTRACKMRAVDVLVRAL